jgi:hypothetical protein
MSYIGGNTNPGNYIGNHPVAGYASSLPQFRNKIINGNFDIWQRGTSQTSSGYGSADRWNNLHSGPSFKTASQGVFALGQTDVPDNPKYYLRTVFTSSGGNGDNCLTLQNIEDVKTLAGQTATLSFWARTTGSNKDIATEIIQYFGTGGSPSPSVISIGTTTHTLTSSWQKFTTTVSIPHLTSTGLVGGTPSTIGTNANDYLGLNFWFEAGSNINSSRTNSLGNQSGTFDIAQVQLEEGTVATPFEHRPIELALCQRYFNKSHNSDLVAGTSATGGGAINVFVPSNGTGYFGVYVPFPVEMRNDPTITLYDSSNASGKVFKGGDGKSQYIFRKGRRGFSGGTQDATNSNELFFTYTAADEL